MGNPSKDKNKEQGDTEGASADSITSPWDAPHTNRDLSQEREASDVTLAKQVVRGMATGFTNLLLFQMYSGFGSTSLLFGLCRQVRNFIRRCF